MTRAEQFTEPVAYHGEGPVWFDSWGQLRFVDMLAGDICSVRADGDVDRLHIGTVAAAFRPRVGSVADPGAGWGAMVAATERGFAYVAPDGAVEHLGELWSDPGVRMNEGGCDPQGRFYCGSMAYDGTPGAGKVWRLDIDGTVSVALDEVTISNGLVWTPDGDTAYYIDTPTGRVDAFDYAPDAGLSHRRPQVQIASGQGGPDGMALDSEGHLWVALFGGSAVHRYTPDGRLDGVVELPVSRVTACTFGGPGRSELYITTSREGLGEGAEPTAGAIFRARPGVSGLPVQPYAG